MSARRSWYLFIETGGGYIAQPVENRRQVWAAIERLAPVVPPDAWWSLRWMLPE